MKKLLFVLCTGMFCLLYSCNEKVTEMIHYKINEPVLMSLKTFRESVQVSTLPQKITNYGKICFYNGYLYISEIEKGIHIIDNSDPSNPKITGFIELLGTADLAIRNGMLYADSYIDLVWFNVDNPAQPELKGRLENVFPYALPSTDNQYRRAYNYNYEEEVVIGWKVREITEPVNYEFEHCTMDGIANNNVSLSSSGSGINGSMSRFVLYQDYLYTVINNYMNIFDLSSAKPEKKVEYLYIGSEVETIFSYKKNMFMGTPTGMLIYAVDNPLNPEYQSRIAHAFGCDPVVVENDIAYVTIHSGNMCGQNTNELIVYDVSNTKNPRHIVSYAMTNPKGLAIDNGTLFLCDDGLKVYNAADPQTLIANRLVHYSGMDGFDVIPFDNVLMMIATDGLYQYDYSDLQKIKQLSMLPIGK